MNFKEKAEKRVISASTAQCKEHRVYYAELSLLNQVKSVLYSSDLINEVSTAMLAIAERAEHRKHMPETREQRDQIQAHEQQQVYKHALFIWEMAKPADPKHPYLVNNQIIPCIARQRCNALVLPIINIEGKICSLQYIHPDGSKVLLKGGRKHGCFMPVHGLISNPEIFIAEGFATASILANIYRNSCVIAALDAGNMKRVATIIRRHQPQATIIVCPDDNSLYLSKQSSLVIRYALKPVIINQNLLKEYN